MKSDLRARAGLRSRLLVGCLAPLIIAVVCQAFYTVMAQRRAMVGGLEEKCRSLNELMVDVVGPSLALDDLHGVQEGLGYIQKDADFAFAATLTSTGQVAGYHGPANERDQLLRLVTVVSQPRVIATQNLLVALAPLTPGTTRLGTVAIGLKTMHVRAAVTRMAIRVVLIAFAGILVALAVVHLLASAIVRRNQDLKLIMDNVAQGFLTVRQDGKLLPEHSAILETWFGAWRDGEHFWSYLGNAAPDAREGLECLWTNVTENVLPVDVSLAQLPARITTGGKIFDIAYQPILKGENLTHVLIVISDVTARVEQENAAVYQRELLTLFQWRCRDRKGLLDFSSDGNRLVDRLLDTKATDRVALKRDLHTLKGNCSVFNLVSLVTICQDIESHFEDGDLALRDVDRCRLRAAWDSVLHRLQQLGATESSDGLEIEQSEYQAILAAIEAGAPYCELNDLLRRWTLEPVKQRLTRLGEQASALAARMKRDNLVVKITAWGIRLPGQALAPFWNTATHLIRNAVDHGLESSDERITAGKAAEGVIELRTVIRDDQLVVEIEDDGRGIDWTKLSTRAQKMGLPSATRDDLVNALFSDGVTTRDQVTDYSGRGVGMSAVRAACIETGGTVRVWSRPGRGTRFEFCWPAALLLGPTATPPAPPEDDAAALAPRPALDGPWEASPLARSAAVPALT
jgi:HPt (histidine-containing phosphotransfer) domain-containing protein